MNTTPTKNTCGTNRDAIPSYTAGQRRRPRKRTDLVVHEMDGEALIFDKMTADTHRLNATAFFVWNACDGRREAIQIADDLTEIYKVVKAEALPHVERTINELAAKQLVFV